jgi:hypothetical protein
MVRPTRAKSMIWSWIKVRPVSNLQALAAGGPGADLQCWRRDGSGADLQGRLEKDKGGGDLKSRASIAVVRAGRCAWSLPVPGLRLRIGRLIEQVQRRSLHCSCSHDAGLPLVTRCQTRRSRLAGLCESEHLRELGVDHPHRKESGQNPVLESLWNDRVACLRPRRAERHVDGFAETLRG